MSIPCPYPDCTSTSGAPTPVPTSGVWVCPRCSRPSAPCRRLLGTVVCGTLNRPLASFCRRCSAPLPKGWYAEQTAAGLAAAEGQSASLDKPGEPVYRFDGLFHAAVNADYPIEVEPVGGHLAVGLPGGQLLLLDPFGERVRVHRRDACWPTDPGDPAVVGTWPVVASEPWLVTFQRDRLRVVNLLSGVAGGSFPTVLTWQAPAGANLLTPPLFVQRAVPRSTPRPADSLVVWAAGSGEEEPTLYWCELTASAGGALAVQEVGFGELKVAGPYTGAALAAVPGPEPRFLLACGRSMALLHSPRAGLVARTASVHDLPPLSLRTSDRALGAVPMLAFLPNPDAADGALGLAAVSCNEGGDVLMVPVKTSVLGVGRHVVKGGGVLLGVARHRGEEAFLTFSGSALKAINRLGESPTVRDLRGIFRIQWARVVGRLFCYTGTENTNAYCAGIIDLDSGVPLEGPADPRREPPRPAVAGRQVFTVGWRGGRNQKTELCLFRRNVQYTDLPLAVEDDVV